jgi:hypothetical protein
MKNLFAAIAATLVFLSHAGAHADELVLNDPNALNQFAARYTLDTFQIATDSAGLNGAGEVTGGTIEINEMRNELRLTLNRHMACPRGLLCIQVMPAPTVITLPIKKFDTDVCGGIDIVAERNLLAADAGLTRIEVQDHNGGFECSGNADDVTFVKRVKVLVTESGMRGRPAVLSVLSGFPFHRQLAN